MVGERTSTQITAVAFRRILAYRPEFHNSTCVPVHQDRMEFLRGDLEHLFDDQGIDKDAYGEVVEFLDPITKYNKLSGAGQMPNPTCLQAQLCSGLP